MAEIYFSEFERALFTWESFGRRCIIWFCCYLAVGFTIARASWRGGEGKYHYLT